MPTILQPAKRDTSKTGPTGAASRESAKRWTLAALTTLASVLAAAGCGGGGGTKPIATPRCVRDSDCSGALACIQTYCVEACVDSKDCPTGQRCIPAAGGNSCQPPEKSTCVYTSDCTQPLVCGQDLQCRAQCQTSVDCLHGQSCTALTHLCADPTVDKNYDPITNEFTSTVAVDGGAPDTTPASPVDAGMSPDTSIVQPDVSLPGPEVAAVDAPSARLDTATVEAAGGDVSASFDGPPILADGVTVTPSPSLHQGQINATLTVTRASGGLASATLFDMGDLTVRAQAGGSDTSLVLKVSVPHGAPLGKRTLKIATSTGVVTAADVVDVTAITAGPTGVDTNAGSAGSPFLTFKQAMLVADVGDTIHLMDGTYNAKGGETWGYVVPDKLTIVGDSTTGTIIDGVGATNNPNGINASTNVTLKSLTLQHFYYGIDLQKPASTVTLQDVVLGNNANHGIYVEQAATGATVNITGKNGLIDQPGETAVYVYNAPNVTVNVTDATLQAGSYVVYFTYNCSGGALNVTGGSIKELATYDAINFAVSSNTTGTTMTLDKATIVGNISDTDSKGSVIITGSTLTQKSGSGIDHGAASLVMTNSSITMTANNPGIYFNGTNATMALTGVTITGGSYAIQQTGTGSSSKLRGTTLTGTTYDTYLLSAGDLDLGTATESGDNTIDKPANASYWCLNINRSQGANSGNPVTCSNTTLNGNAPTPGTIDASAGPVSQAPQRYYLSTGNKLIFY
jgi:hypothetical protein